MYNVMIVDDYDIYHDELKALNVWGEQSGFVITAEASGGRDALKKLSNAPADLLITDIRMPIIDGIELTKRVFEDKLCKCVVLMSQFNEFEYARQGIAIGAFDYLLKPVEKSDLIKTLQRAHDYIAQRDEEISKIDYLDQMLNSRTQEHYPKEMLKQLVKDISDGSGASAHTAKKLLETIWAEVGFDVLKSGYVLNRGIMELSEDIKKEFPWMEKLAVPFVRNDTDFSAFKSFDEMQNSFLQIIDGVTGIVLKYELGINSSKLVRMACKYVLENIDAQISLQILSKKLFISSSYLSLLFKEKTGINLIEYITFIKMERAKILLRDSSLKNYEIADRLGFSIEYFSKLFKKTFDITPTRYRSAINEEH